MSGPVATSVKVGRHSTPGDCSRDSGRECKLSENVCRRVADSRMTIGTPSLIPLRANISPSGGTRRVTSPTFSKRSAPERVGQGISSSGSQTHLDKQATRINTGSTCSSSSSSSKNNTSSKLPFNNKNSMLDKFKFFKDKDKDKDKEKDKNKGVVKSSSKSGSTSTASTSSRSDTDSRTSGSESTKSPSFTSSQSSSSGDHVGASSDETTSGTLSAATTSSKSTSKAGKKSVVKAFSSRKDAPDEQSRSAVPPPIPSAVGLGPPTGGPYVSSTLPSSVSQRNASPSYGRKASAKSEKSDTRSTDPRFTAASPTLLSTKKNSKISSSTGAPKTQSASSSSSTKPSKTISSTATPIPTSSSSLSIAVSSSNTPKSSFIKMSGKLLKDEKSRGIAASKDHKKCSSKDPSGVNEYKSNGVSSKTSSSQQYQQLQQQAYHLSQQQQAYQMQQHQHYSQLAYPLPQQQEHEYQGYSPQCSPRHHAQSMAAYSYNTPQSYIPPYAHNPGYATPAHTQANSALQNAHPGLNVHNMQWLQHSEQQKELDQQQHMGQISALASSQQGSGTQMSHFAPLIIPAVNLDTHPTILSQTGRSVKHMLPQGSMISPNLLRHNLSVNVVKPTVSSSTPTTSSQKSSKSDSNTQTNLSVMHKSVTPKHVTSSSESASQTETVTLEKFHTVPSSPSSVNKSTRNKPSTVDQIGDSLDSSEQAVAKNSARDKNVDICDTKKQNDTESTVSGLSKLRIKDAASESKEKLFISSGTCSPRLGVKMLGSHVSKTACNVAVVQPHSGEKRETSFDTEVRTETLTHKVRPDSDVTRAAPGMENTFLTPDKDDKATFVDDAGETMDIKPMPPIMRALPYGYFRGYSGYGSFNNRNFHIPGISVPATAMHTNRTTSAQVLAMPCVLADQGPVKFYSEQLKGADSSSCPNSASSDADYASESDTCDYVSGYMSDGDILKNRNSGAGSGDEWTSGYLSEGGASLYARRLQQRFREGMQAVRECMQKSSRLTDDDSFEDSSSVSSGEISDVFGEISTDENLTGSSQGAISDNAYNCLKRAPNDISSSHGRFGPGNPVGALCSSSSLVGKKIPNLGTSVFMGTEYSDYSSFVDGSPRGRKYSLPQIGTILSNDPNKLLSGDSSEYGYGWPSSRSDSGPTFMRKMSSVSNPDYAYHSEGDYDPHNNRSYSPAPGMKKDIETNTDQSHLLEASVRRLQAGKLGNITPPSGSGSAQYGYSRSLSNASNSSGGSNKISVSKTQNQGSFTVGSRLAKHAVENGQTSVADLMISRPASAMDRPVSHDVTLMESYSSSSLDRKKTNVGISPSKSTGSTQTDRDFQSNSLGRLRLFGNKGKHSQTDTSGFVPPLVGSTIISNPHATYSRDKQTSHYVNLEELQARISGSSYAPVEFVNSPRNSGIGGPAVGSASMWLKSSSSSNGVGFPPPPSPHSPHPFHAHAMSDSETFESLANPNIQAQIQQARALANVRMLAHHPEMLPLSASPPSSSSSTQCLQRSNSIKSDSAYSSTKFSSFNDELSRTDSFSQSTSPPQLQTIPSSHIFSPSSRMTFPMVYGPSTSCNDPAPGLIMIRSSTHSSLPYFRSCGSRNRTSRDEDDSRLSKSFTLDYSFISDCTYMSSAHGSTLSLVSSSSSMFSSSEEKHAHEVRKLKRDLLIAQEKVQALTNQLSTNF